MSKSEIKSISRSAEEKHSFQVVDEHVIRNMSNGLSFSGLNITFCREREDIRLTKSLKPLFTFTGKIELCNSPMDRSYMDKFELKNVKQFKRNVLDAVEKKFGFDACIGIDHCESSVKQEFHRVETQNEDIKIKKIIIVSFTYLPIGSFKIPNKIRILTTEAFTALQNIETEEHALDFLKDFGSHYPDPENVFHYGGVEMSYHSENAADTSTTTGKKESGKTSGRAKVKGLRGFFFKGKKGVHLEIKTEKKEYAEEKLKSRERRIIHSIDPLAAFYMFTYSFYCAMPRFFGKNQLVLFFVVGLI